MVLSASKFVEDTRSFLFSFTFFLHHFRPVGLEKSILNEGMESRDDRMKRCSAVFSVWV